LGRKIEPARRRQRDSYSVCFMVVWHNNLVKGSPEMKTITITAELIPEDEGGFTVYCPELDIYTQGDTEEECLENMREAAELHIEEVECVSIGRTMKE
jgi:predicted RNase H-like HicB family nuclease